MPEKPLKICLVSSELTPLAKTGGLADVNAALSAFLDNKGHDVRVLIPFYSAVDTKSLVIVPDPSLQNLSIQIGNHHLNYSIDTTTLPNTALKIYLYVARNYTIGPAYIPTAPTNTCALFYYRGLPSRCAST